MNQYYQTPELFLCIFAKTLQDVKHSRWIKYKDIVIKERNTFSGTIEKKSFILFLNEY